MNKLEQIAWVLRWKQFGRKQDALNVFLQQLDWNADKDFIEYCLTWMRNQKPEGIKE